MKEISKPVVSAKKRPSKRPVKKESSSLTVRRTEDHVKELLVLHQLVPEHRFPNALLFSSMKRLMDERLGGMEYSPACSSVATELSESIKEAAKGLSSGRYKLICCVAIGQLRNSAVSCSSRGVWNPDTDTFTEYLFKNHHLFGLGVLFAVYQE